MTTIDEIKQEGQITEATVSGDVIKKETYIYQSEDISVDNLKARIDSIRTDKQTRMNEFDTEIAELQSILLTGGITY